MRLVLQKISVAVSILRDHRCNEMSDVCDIDVVSVCAFIRCVETPSV